MSEDDAKALRRMVILNITSGAEDEEGNCWNMLRTLWRPDRGRET